MRNFRRGTFLGGGTADAIACFTVRRWTPYFFAQARCDSDGSQRTSRRMCSNSSTSDKPTLASRHGHDQRHGLRHDRERRTHPFGIGQAAHTIHSDEGMSSRARAGGAKSNVDQAGAKRTCRGGAAATCHKQQTVPLYLRQHLREPARQLVSPPSASRVEGTGGEGTANNDQGERRRQLGAEMKARGMKSSDRAEGSRRGQRPRTPDRRT
jgi:hypothetical protein